MLQQKCFQQALPVLQKIEEAGYEAYFVGGCVRDALLEKDISDIDIATSAYPEEIKRIFKRTVDVGIEHGTVLVLWGEDSYEITTFRTESTYQDFRRPDSVTFVRSLEEDLKRRDFTINAFALDCRGKLYDFHDGQQDLSKHTLKAVGQATERFHEDALRMMRAVRFCAQLGFDLEEDTKQGVIENASLLERIAIERVCVEFEKLLAAPHKQLGLQLLLETQLYRYFPQVIGLEQALNACLHLPALYSATSQNWAILVYYLNLSTEEARVYLKAWKLSNQIIEDALTLLTILQFRQTQQWSKEQLFVIGMPLCAIGEQMCLDLKIIQEKEEVEQLYQELPIHSVKDLAINGKDVMVLCNQQQGGRYVGEWIDAIKHEVLHGQLANEKDVLVEYVLTKKR